MPLPHDVHALLGGLPWTVLDTFDTPFGTFRRSRIAITEPHDDDVWLAWRAHKAALKPLGYRVWLDEASDTWHLDHDDDPRRGATPDPKLDQAFLDELPWGESERVHHREFGDTHRATAVLDARSEIVFWPLWNVRKDALLRSGYAVGRQGRRGAWYVQRHIELSEEERDRDRERARLSRAHDADATLTSPDGLDYLPYQRAGILYALDRPRTLLADAPGLGKTIQALGAIGNDPDGGLPALVIVPASLKLNWTRETQAWLPDAYPIRLNGRLPPALRTTFLAALDQLGLEPDAPPPGPDAVREALGDAEAALFAGEAVTWRKHVRLPDTPIRQVEASHLLGALFHPRALILLNYDIATSWEPLLARLPGLSTLVLDEIHYCKNGKAKRTKAVRRLAKRFARAIGMTGTPIVNRPAELLPQLDILGVIEELFGTGWNFLQRYTNAQRTQFGWDFTGASNLDELQERLRSRVMVRRRKEDVLTELPAKRRQIVELEIGDTKVQRLVDHERDTYRKHEEEVTRHRAAVAAARERGEDASYRAAVERLREAEGLAFSEIAAARYEVAMSKVPSVTEYLATALESGEKIVCFAHHKDVVTALEEAFAGHSVTISGKTAPDRRQAAVDRFQNDESVRLFIGNIAAAGVGLTLTASSHVVFAELDWTPAAMTQAEDRSHRYGQQDRVLITHLVWDGSLDATMARTLVGKQRVAEQAMDKLPADDGEQASADRASTQPTHAAPAPLDGQVGETGAAPLFEPEGAGEGDSEGEGPSLAELRRRHGRDPRSEEQRQHEHQRGLVQGRAARIRSHSPALPRFDARQAAALHASMQHLAAEDPDRARARNAAGFSKADGPVGHHLAQEATLGSDELLVAYNLALTYQGQLPAQLLLAAGILDLEAELAERQSKENPA